MKKCISLILVLSFLLLVFPSCSPKSKYAKSFYLFDTYCSLTCYDISSAEFDNAFEDLTESLTLFHEETDIYHEYDSPNAATLNRLAGEQAVPLSEELLTFLGFAKEAYALSLGKVNVMLGAVTSLWHETRETMILPEDTDLLKAASLCSIDYLEIYESSAYISVKGASLDLGALAKGYAGRIAGDILNRKGIENYLLNLGGTIVLHGYPKGTGRDTFSIGIENPSGTGSYSKVLSLPGGSSVATSGDYQRYVTIDGVRYHHLIDPETLYPAVYHSSVTVVCDDPALADLLSTALIMMSEEDGNALAGQFSASVYYN